MMPDRSAARFAAVVAKQRQTEALDNAQNVVDSHTQWLISHLSEEDRTLIRSVTGEDVLDQSRTPSMFAITLAQSRANKPSSAPLNSAHMSLLGRSAIKTQHDRVATFTSMRAMLGGNAVGRSLDLEA